MINLLELKESLEERLDRGRMSSSLLLSRMRVLSERSRLSPSYNDDWHVPFYYHLGTLVSPESVVEYGFDLGLLSSAFFMGCRSVRKFLAFQQ